MFAGYKNQIPRWRMAGLGMNSPSESYIDKVLGIQSASLIGYWPLNETSGTNADNAEETAARDGTYTGVVLNSILGPDGVNGAPLFDGIGDFVDVYSASLNTAFAASPNGTMAIWMRVLNVGIWTDGALRMGYIVRISGANRLQHNKLAANNQMQALYNAGGVADAITRGGIAETDWFHWAMTWDVGADEMRVYFNGIQEGATQGTIGTLVGNLDTIRNVIGAADTVPNSLWSGYLAHGYLNVATLTPAEVLDLATV